MYPFYRVVASKRAPQTTTHYYFLIDSIWANLHVIQEAIERMKSELQAKDIEFVRVNAELDDTRIASLARDEEFQRVCFRSQRVFLLFTDYSYHESMSIHQSRSKSSIWSAIAST